MGHFAQFLRVYRIEEENIHVPEPETEQEEYGMSKIAMLAAAALAHSVLAAGAEVPSFDFTTTGGAEGWEAAHDIAKMEPTPQGLRVEINGADPYIIGPSQDYPAGAMLSLKLRIKSEQGGDCQVFYFTVNATEEASVHMHSKGGDWEELEAVLPPLGPQYRLRIDPPGKGGTAIIASLRFTASPVLKEPAWPKPEPPALTKDALVVKSGSLELAHAPGALGAFVLREQAKVMACGNTRPLIGYVQNGQQYWIDVAKQAAASVEKRHDRVGVRASFTDAQGANWRVEQSFCGAPAAQPKKPPAPQPEAPWPYGGAIDVETRVSVSEDREVCYLPLLTILPGVGSFGEKKGQGLFAGLEYLDDEPSSSEADIVGPASKRQVPDTLKITFPLMAIQNAGSYVGLIWGKCYADVPTTRADETPPLRECGALFDSPDRLFHSGGHVMGVLFPGSNGRNRVEGSLLPHFTERLRGNEPLVMRATLIGGPGDSVIPAVQQYVALRELPPVPDPMNFQSYVALASRGWLDSKIREDGLVRHAVWPGFGPQMAADAALWMDWLAGQTKKDELAQRLKTTSPEVLAKVPPREYERVGVSHVRYPVVSLYYGHVAENLEATEAAARRLLASFEPDGSVHYKKAPSHPDYAKTHWTTEANGLAAQGVAALLQQASVCGNQELLRGALRVLRALNKFDNTVPRGAQTWEVPLHTPDILASAHLVKAYTLGYELTGEKEFLNRAVYWAWTGVPFVYLIKPTPQPVGVYATIAVLGATNWQAPVWFGQPVQWCGLVYADALWALARYDTQGPWEELAKGITACGIQFTWPQSDKERQGLLPDVYHLREQVSDGPAINPGTVQANAVRLYGRPAVYGFHASRENGWFVHAPGEISAIKERKGRISLKVQCPLDKAHYVLVSSLSAKPWVRINDEDTVLDQPHQFVERTGWLILQLAGGTKAIQVSVDPF